MNKKMKKAKKYATNSAAYFALSMIALGDAVIEFFVNTLAGKMLFFAGIFSFGSGLSIAIGYDECAGCCALMAIFLFAVAAADLKGLISPEEKEY